jgi:hypothetical protein
MLNYCIINENGIYGELHDLIEKEELTMLNPNHEDKIKYLIGDLVKNKKEIEFNDKRTNDINDIISEVLEILISKNTQEESQGNTLVVYSDINEMIEIIFIEKDVNFEDCEINEFASISNYDLQPIYNGCALFKTNYKNNNIKNTIITLKDIENILYYNFYHIGLLVDCDKNTKEIIFSGDLPHNFIGSSFKLGGNFERLGLHLAMFVEEGNRINEIASKIGGTEIKGRIYITLLNPPYNKKFGNFTKELLEVILKVLDNKEIVKKIEDEVLNDKLDNSYMIINKYLLN